jgi:hypothetical protein
VGSALAKREGRGFTQAQQNLLCFAQEQPRLYPTYKGFRGFDKIVAALGRKQIPVCSQCHHNIHNGKYDGMSLEELYDVRLVTPCRRLRENLTYHPNNNQHSKSLSPTFERKTDFRRSNNR